MRIYPLITMPYQLYQVRKNIKKKKFWFVDIPRTSSTHIQVNLSQGLGFPYGKKIRRFRGPEKFTSPILPAHVPAYRAEKIIGKELWGNIHTFSVVREPLDWSISAWGYRIRYAKYKKSYREFLLDLESISNTNLFSRKIKPFNFTQSDYLLGRNEKFIVENIFDFKDREGIRTFIKRTVGVDFIEVVLQIRTVC